jgi:hypothetical protein
MLETRAAPGIVVRHVRDTGLALNTPDTEWARYCKKHRLVFVTEDQKIRRRPQEMEAFRKARIGYVEARIHARAGPEILAVYDAHADKLLALVSQPVPFCRVLTKSGLRAVGIEDGVRRSRR